MNSKQIATKWVSLLVLSTGFSLVGGCGKESSSDSKIIQTPPSAPPSASMQTTNQPEHQPPINSVVKTEEYELMAAQEIPLTAQISAREFEQAADCSGDIQGTVDILQVGSTQLELETNAIVHEDNKAWIVTKSYGKIRISGGYAGDHPPSGLCFWLTPSQKARLKKLN
jgi:hypothetical protein